MSGEPKLRDNEIEVFAHTRLYYMDEDLKEYLETIRLPPDLQLGNLTFTPDAYLNPPEGQSFATSNIITTFNSAVEIVKGYIDPSIAGSMGIPTFLEKLPNIARIKETMQKTVAKWKLNSAMLWEPPTLQYKVKMPLKAQRTALDNTTHYLQLLLIAGWHTRFHIEEGGGRS